MTDHVSTCGDAVHLAAARLAQDHCGYCGQPVVWWCMPPYPATEHLGGSHHRNGLWAKFCTTCGKPKP